jgi:hypothetical protein
MQPYVFSKDFTLSMYEKANLRKVLESWRGKAFTNEQAESFDITALVGKPCLLNIIHKQVGDKTYANIAGISAMPKGMTCSPQINESVVFNVEEFDQKVFDGLSEYVQNKIKRSREYVAFQNPNVTHDEPASSNSPEPETDDDLPF